MCIFLSASLIKSVTQQLQTHYPPDTPVAVVSRATWPDQKILHGTLESIATQMESGKISKTAMILVGPFLRDRGELSKLYDSSFTTEYRSGE
jgi:precorrin-4/cobalt-precorrin-4 C11-methyltransferase